MSYSLSDLMELVLAEHGDAVHLHDGNRPVLEIRRQLYTIEGPPLDAGDTQTLLRSIAPPSEFQEALRGCTAFKHRHGDGALFHVMAFREDGSIRLELRRVI